MTSDAATQELQRLLQTQGWQDLVEMMVSVAKNGLPLFDASPASPNAPTRRSDRLPFTRNATQHLLEMLQETSLHDSRQVGAREVDMGFCFELGRIVGLVESFGRHEPKMATLHRPKDSGTVVWGMGLVHVAAFRNTSLPLVN